MPNLFQTTATGALDFFKNLAPPKPQSPFAQGRGAVVPTFFKPVSKPQTNPVTSYKPSLDDVMSSITTQEGGKYTTVNPDSGALGKYQIMPFHLPSIGLPNNASGIAKFKSSPELQDKLFKKIFDDLYKKYGSVEKVVAAYYGGGGGAAKYGTKLGDIPQGKYPSINKYVAEVMGRAQKGKVASATKMEEDNPLPKFFSDVKEFIAPTFEQQIQAVQNDRRSSLLPEVSRKLAFERDREMGLLRMPQINPATGKSEPTGLVMDPFAVGAIRRVGVQGFKVVGDALADGVKGLVGKTSREVEKLLPKIVEGTPESLKGLAAKLTRATDVEGASKIIYDEIQFFKSAAPPVSAKAAGAGGKPPVPPVKGTAVPGGAVPEPPAPKVVDRDFTKQAEKIFPASKTEADNLITRLDALGLGTRTVRTHAEVEAAAQELGTDVATMLKIAKDKPISDVEGQALKNTIRSANSFIQDAQTQISRDPSKAPLLEGQIQQASKLIDDALKKLAPGVTEVGRALSALRMQANESLDPAVWFLKAQRMLGPRNLTDDMRGHIQNLIDNKDRLGLSQYVSMLRTASWAEKAATLWKAGLLTSPTTHAANILGNTTMATLESSSNVVSTTFDVLASLFTGVRTTTFSAGTIAGKARGLVTGLQKAGHPTISWSKGNLLPRIGFTGFLKTGTYSSDVVSKYEVRQITFENKILDGYKNAVFRSLGAEDIIFREVAMQEAFVTQAEVIAKNLGLRGQAYKEKVRELLEKPTNEMVMNAIEAAEYQTFQQDSKLADLITGAKVSLQNSNSLIAKWGGLFAEFVAPFSKTPINIAKAIGDYSPIGFIKAVLRAIPATTRSQKNFVTDMGRATTGTGVIVLGAYLAQQGMMTGNAPTEKNERDMFYAEGKQPNSILIGGSWFKLSRISPFGNLLSLGAEFNENGRELEGAALAGATFWGGVKTLSEMTFLQGVSGTMKAINDPEQYAPSYVERGLGSFIPTIVAHTAKAIDPRLRVPEGILESLKSRTPGLSKEVPVRRDIFGNPVVAPGGATAIVNPFAQTKAVDNPVIKAAKEVGVDIGLPTPTVSGIKMDNAEYSLYQKVQGKLLEQTLKTLIDSPGYQILTVTEKEKEFKNTITEVRQQINDSVFPALMIRRYNLPEDTNPAYIRIALSELSKNDKFKRMSTGEQEKAVKKLLQIP